MDPASPRVLLTTVVGSFHARVLEARLRAEGVGVELRGLDEGPYPLAIPVDVLVREPDLALAREILLADAIDAAFVEDGAETGPTEAGPTEPGPAEAGPEGPGTRSFLGLRRRRWRREAR